MIMLKLKNMKKRLNNFGCFLSFVVFIFYVPVAVFIASNNITTDFFSLFNYITYILLILCFKNKW